MNLLQFPEPSEFCLGYTARGTRGSGSGAHGAVQIADAMCDAIARGVERLEHFDELGIFHEGIGPDRISDIVCTVLKSDFITYTQDVARAHDIALDERSVGAVGFDPRRLSGPKTETVALPTNPKTGGPIVLVPQRFLRKLPALNADDWFNSNEAAELRRELNVDVMTKVSKKVIVRLARSNPSLVSAWTRRKEKEGASPYDLDRDPAGVYAWVDDTLAYAIEHPLQLTPPKSDTEFTNVIVVDREVELGRGPVDFKFSNGYMNRALLEVKKLHNGRFWNGLENQLTSYMKSDKTSLSWFLAVRYLTEGVSKKRIRQLPQRVNALADRTGHEIRYQAVDARPKVSASKLKRPVKEP